MPIFPVSSLDPFVRAGFKEAAEKLADELVARRRVNAIADIAEAIR